MSRRARTNPARRHGAAMIEALLVLPLVMFVLSLVVYFGLSMHRLQRMTMLDRYEARRSVTRAPGPSATLEQDLVTGDLRRTFFPAGGVRLGIQPTDYFPPEATEELELAAGQLDLGAEQLMNRYLADLPRGRSMRFFLVSTSSTALWDRLFPGAVAHRHALMDTDWRFFNYVTQGNEWFDDRSETWELLLDPARDPDDQGLPTLGPSDSVREVFYSEFDRRIDPLAVTNPLASRIQDFFLDYPAYTGPELPLFWSPQTGRWERQSE